MVTSCNYSSIEAATAVHQCLFTSQRPSFHAQRYPQNLLLVHHKTPREKACITINHTEISKVTWWSGQKTRTYTLPSPWPEAY
ncbi:hypothetical protein E2C01_005553 [Portunus trituberculatus]|uniref:Uncharacterized protein n=1 Tax=Portunus trituberculatus TaxID=210409 RepID=A0A5B7CTV2_PORTR|nr:hypothetical protein [Portunus trituberculatus]